jgi:hypothetical protein
VSYEIVLTAPNEYAVSYTPPDAYTVETGDPSLYQIATATVAVVGEGLVSAVFVCAAEALEDIPAGMPVALNRVSGKALLARADTFVASFVVGLAASATDLGHICNIFKSSITLADWTNVAGTTSLTPGTPYFLGETGGLTTEKPQLGATVVVGKAVSLQTLNCEPTLPILL